MHPTMPAAHRPGPRPLALHLLMADLILLTSLSAWPRVKLGSLNWNPSLQSAAAELEKQLQSIPAEGFQAALTAEALRRLETMLSGVSSYRAHQYKRNLDEPPVLWREGATRLLDYRTASNRSKRPTALFVPSLVNQHYILDLSARRSLLRWLASQGVDPLLVDWGYPGPAEASFGLSDYIAGRLEQMLSVASAEAKGRVILVGYCMGGNLALACAQRNQDKVRGLALLATPWDLHADPANHGQGQLIGALRPLLETMIDRLGELPIDALQAIFLSLDPSLGVKKFSQFTRLDPKSAEAEDFVAMEDWLNDGVPLTAKVARETLIGWYANNSMARGAWQVAETLIDPRAIDLPAFAAIPRADRIVPPASAEALARALPNCTTLNPPSGHIGMVASPRAPEGLWQPLRDWIFGLPG